MAVQYRIRRSDNEIVAGPYFAGDATTFRVDFAPAGNHTYHVEVQDDGAGGIDVTEVNLVGLVIKR